MPLFTTLAALSQTAASNPPDGNVDSPSSIDEQLRLLASFIAQLRDGVGFTGPMTLSSLNVGQLAGLRNALINGDFQVAQRGTAGLGGGYGLDRWFLNAAGTGLTVSQGGGGNISADTSLGATLDITGAAGNTDSNVLQNIESKNAIGLAGRQVTASVWVWQNSGAAKNFSIVLSNANAVDNFGVITLIGSSAATPVPNATWTRITYTVALPAGGSGNGLQFQVITGAIGAGVLCRLGAAQLECGPAATPFEKRPFGLELALCQRYLPAINETVADIGIGFATGTAGGVVDVPFLVEPRVPPTGIATTAAGTFSLTSATNNTAVTALTFASAGKRGARLSVTGTGTPYAAHQPLILLAAGAAQILFTGCEL